MYHDEYALSSWVEVLQLFFWALWGLLPVHCVLVIAGRKSWDWTIAVYGLLLVWCGTLVLALINLVGIYGEGRPPAEERLEHWGLMFLLLLAAHGVLRLISSFAPGRRS